MPLLCLISIPQIESGNIDIGYTYFLLQVSAQYSSSTSPFCFYCTFSFEGKSNGLCPFPHGSFLASYPITKTGRRAITRTESRHTCLSRFIYSDRGILIDLISYRLVPLDEFRKKEFRIVRSAPSIPPSMQAITALFSASQPGIAVSGFLPCSHSWPYQASYFIPGLAFWCIWASSLSNYVCKCLLSCSHAASGCPEQCQRQKRPRSAVLRLQLLNAQPERRAIGARLFWTGRVPNEDRVYLRSNNPYRWKAGSFKSSPLNLKVL